MARIAPSSKHPQSGRANAILGVIAAGCALCAALPAVAESDADLPLPRWTPELARPKAAAVPDAGQQFNQLLPPENALLPPPVEVLGMLETGPRLAEGPPSLLNGAASDELGSRDLTLFLHGGLLKQANAAGATAPAPPTPAISLVNMPEEMLAEAAQAKADDYLLDPQYLVPEVPRQDLDRLLEFHAKDARIRLFILVLDNNQKLPANAALDLIAQGALTKRDACLAVYPLGEPWRARFLVSQSVHQAVSVTSITALAEDCIKDAQQATDPVQQLHRFTVRLSTRLFGLEKALPATAVKQTASAHLHEVSPGLPASAADSSATVAVAAGASLTALLVLIGMVAAFLFCLRSYRRNRELSRVWILPEQEVSPRLGGAFSGGAGAMIRYGNAQQV